MKAPLHHRFDAGPLLFPVLLAALIVASPPLIPATLAQPVDAAPRRVEVLASTDLRLWDATLDRMDRDGTLQLRQRRDDAMLDGWTQERYDQYYRGVRVVGGDMTRQLDGGLTRSIFGTVYEGIAVDTTVRFTAAAARERIVEMSGAELPDSYEPELVILPHEGHFALAWQGRAFGAEGLYQYFIDAHSGELLLSLNDLKSQTSAVGTGPGVLGDTKKMSTNRVTGGYRTEDELRPPTLVTFDMKANLTRTLSFLNGATSLVASDIASDSDNAWTDPAVVDAHAYAGYVYDYYFKRFGRRGLDGADSRILALVHPVDRNAVRTQSNQVIGLFYLNAFYAGGGVMVFGEGLPPGLTTVGGQSWNYLSGALDVFAHELTHGVTDYSSRLIYQGESGALNEAFSDILGASAEAYFQQPGNGLLRADYLMGEDVVTPGGLRSLANPGAFGDPDHYTRRYTGTLDNGGVHTNSTIASHAFYLAIEGGTNRTSGLAVTGVGFANREQIERAFYRGFTQLMPSDATFAVARAVTIQAATDLYGANSAAVRAITQAWTAVGVN